MSFFSKVLGLLKSKISPAELSPHSWNPPSFRTKKPPLEASRIENSKELIKLYLGEAAFEAVFADTQDLAAEIEQRTQFILNTGEPLAREIASF